MKIKISIVLAIITTFFYLMNFMTLTHLIHAIAILLLSMFYLITVKLAADDNKANFIFRLWINAMFVIILIVPLFIEPDYFSISLKIVRTIASVAVILGFVKKENSNYKKQN